jgi:hypothetical protein
MNRRLVTSNKGLTLVEILISFAIFSLITVIVTGYLISSLNNFKKVNEEIVLHDEANHIMSKFVNYIFVATKVKVLEQSESKSLIEVTDFDGNVTTLGFENNRAVINGESIHPSRYRILTEGTEGSMMIIQGDTVHIKMVIQDELSKYDQKLELNSDVSFINVQ